MKQIERPTRDLDLVAIIKHGKFISAEPLPYEFEKAVEEVGIAFGLGKNWVDGRSTHLLRDGLPPGFVNRMHTKNYKGITVHLADRIVNHKSVLKPLESPALLIVRTRSIFGPGARADLVSFFLTHAESDFSVADVTEIGYSKRNLAEILEEFSLSGLFDKFLVRNQLRYRLAKNERLFSALRPIPDFAPSWRAILEVILPLRDCIKQTETKTETIKMIEIRNILNTLKNNLKRLNLTPPSFQSNPSVFLNEFQEWILEIVRKLAVSDFPDKHYLSTH